MAAKAESLTDLVERLESAADDGDPTVDHILKAAGGRSLGAILFGPALIAASPIGAIPGMSIAMGTVIVLFAIQFALGRSHLWTPGVIARRKAPADKVRSGAAKMRKPARWLDRWLGGRLTWATNSVAETLVGIVACLLGVAMYPLAIVPFGVFVPAVALALLSAGLMTRDGLLVILGLAASVGVPAMLVFGI